MKKYILLLVTALSFAQSSNQMVSDLDAQSGGFTLRNGQFSTNTGRCFTKDAAMERYWLNSTPFDTYASNQLVPKSLWEDSPSFSWNFTDFTSDATGACSLSNFTKIYYSADIAPEIGVRLFLDTARNSVVIGDDFWAKEQISGMVYQIGTSGIIINSSTCIPPIVSYPYAFTLSNTSAISSCSSSNAAENNWWSYANTIAVGIQLFTTSDLSTPIVGGDLWYKDTSTGTTSYKIDNNGYIIEEYFCE